MNGNQDKLFSKLQEDKATDSAKAAFKRRPYETLAQYTERRVRADICNGCFGAANNDCAMCERKGK